MSYEINKIKMIISDVDGVWTDGAIYKGKDGIELKRFEESHEKMIVRYEGFTGLEVYHMAKDGKNSLLQSNEFWDTYEEQIQNCRETWIGNEKQLNSCIQQVHVDLDIEN